MGRNTGKIFAGCTIILLQAAVSTQVCASDFSLPFVSVSGLGNAYSGWAADAYDASTTYTNPAGLVKIKSPQLIIAAVRR